MLILESELFLYFTSKKGGDSGKLRAAEEEQGTAAPSGRHTLTFDTDRQRELSDTESEYHAKVAIF